NFLSLSSATMVLLSALQHTPGAQPKNIIGGNLIGAIVGVILSHVIPSDYDWISGALAVSLTILFMQLSDTLHPPAGMVFFYFLIIYYCFFTSTETIIFLFFFFQIAHEPMATTEAPTLIPTLPTYDNYLSFKALLSLCGVDGFVLIFCLCKILHEICASFHTR